MFADLSIAWRVYALVVLAASVGAIVGFVFGEWSARRGRKTTRLEVERFALDVVRGFGRAIRDSQQQDPAR